MKLQRRIKLLCMIFPILCLCACGESTDSGIVQSRMGSGTVNAAKQQDTEEENSVSDTEEASTASDLYIVTKIDTGKKTVSVQKVQGGRQEMYTYDTGTRFLNKYGDSMAADSFQPGDVATLQVASGSTELKQIQLSGDVWIQENLQNYSVDEEIHAFIIGKTKYSYDEEMEIFSGDAKLKFSELSEYDVLRAVGIDKKLISLAVTSGHGYLALSNTEIFEDSFICVGSKIFEIVTKNMKIEVPEGKQLVTVANNGYGGSREVTIQRGQTTSLNLDELKGEGPKFCKIKFTVGVEGAVLTIDGKQVDYSQPVEVQYGIHTIAVGADGYDTITEKLVVNSKEAEIEIALTSASSSSSESDTDSSSTNQNTDTSNSNTDNTTNNSNNTDNSNNTNNNTNNSNNTNSDTNNNSNSNNNTDSNSNTNSDSSSTDYLTTLYNLLTSINESNSSSTNSYDNLVDQ